MAIGNAAIRPSVRLSVCPMHAPMVKMVLFRHIVTVLIIWSPMLEVDQHCPTTTGSGRNGLDLEKFTSWIWYHEYEDRYSYGYDQTRIRNRLVIVHVIVIDVVWSPSPEPCLHPLSFYVRCVYVHEHVGNNFMSEIVAADHSVRRRLKTLFF